MYYCAAQNREYCWEEERQRRLEVSEEKLEMSVKLTGRHNVNVQRSNDVMFRGSEGGSYLQDG